ncbi:uncharacterized protein C19orf84 homolog [Vombatus ursinus]|uniref:uncharacterized protein C19orf84 homolog n=1 Tax=Vombatus ursinus TaxID=29139 RepID=UPI000FFD7094|nr:uncharacterized protein C19orf84 homolog [Vombatus ursinus]
MDQWRERAESGGTGLSEPQKPPTSIPSPQPLALSQVGPGTVMAAGSGLPQLPEGLAALTIPIRLDALSYLLHSALLGAYSLRPGPPLCPCHPNPCCARPPVSDQPVAQDAPKQHWARSQSQREALWSGEVGPSGGRQLGAPVGTIKQNRRARPSPVQPPVKDQRSEYQRRRPPPPLPKSKKEWESRHHHRRAVAASAMPPPEEWERESQPCRPPAPPPQPTDDCDGRYQHQRAPAVTTTPPAEDWESEYQGAQSPQDATLVCSENVLLDPGNEESSPDAQAPQP